MTEYADTADYELQDQAHHAEYMHWKEVLLQLVYTQDYIPLPDSPEYAWPRWAKNSFLSPYKSNRDRFTLFVFLIRNSNAPIDVIRDYLFWWIDHGVFITKEQKDSAARHYRQMIGEWKSGDNFKRLKYLKKDWYSILEHKVMQGAQSIDEVSDQVNIWTFGAPPEVTTTTVTMYPPWGTDLLPDLPIPESPPLLTLHDYDVIPAAVGVDNGEEEFWTNFNQEDEFLNAAYEETKQQYNGRQKKLRRTRTLPDGTVVSANRF